MKEYIEKDELKKGLKNGKPAVGTHDAEIYRSGYDYCESVIQYIPTVTKVDICREFAKKVKKMMKMPEYGFCDIERIMEIALAEMENEE